MNEWAKFDNDRGKFKKLRPSTVPSLHSTGITMMRALSVAMLQVDHAKAWKLVGYRLEVGSGDDEALEALWLG